MSILTLPDAKWAVGMRVRVVASPGSPWHGREGTIIELHTRKNGSIRYTVEDAEGRSAYLSEGSLRVGASG